MEASVVLHSSLCSSSCTSPPAIQLFSKVQRFSSKQLSFVGVSSQNIFFRRSHSTGCYGLFTPRKPQLWSVKAFISSGSVASSDARGNQVMLRSSPYIEPSHNSEGQGETMKEEEDDDSLDNQTMIRVCDKLIEVFLVDMPSPAEWRKLLGFSKEWNEIGPHFYERCHDRAESENDPIMKQQLFRLGRKLKEIDEDIQRQNELYEMIKGVHSEIEMMEIVRKRRKYFTKEFFTHLHTIAESYCDDSVEQKNVVNLQHTCMAVVQMHDDASESMEALNVAEMKIQDILNSPTVSTACRKIDSLAEKNQLDSATMLLMTKAWSTGKETNVSKDEVKDIMYHMYKTAVGSVQRDLPKEIRIVNYVVQLEDPEERLSALKDAFTPGPEIEGEHVDRLYTTPEKLHSCIKSMVDAYNFSEKGALPRQARDLMNPKWIAKLGVLQKIIQDNFL